MKIRAIKTDPVIPGKNNSLLVFLDKEVGRMSEKNILVITSKIVSICEGRVVKEESVDKEELVKQEADYYLPREFNKYGYSLTISKNTLIPSAGIDLSNSNGYYVLWPKNPQKTANKTREFLIKKFKLKYVGVLITDSKTLPLRLGTVGTAIAHSGFLAIKDYIGKPDIFGRRLEVTVENISESLAAAAVAMMGEGNEQTPLALIEDLPFIQFQARNPTKKELEKIHIPLEDDLYAPLIVSKKWIKKK